MCVGFWALEHPEYALILCSNRDEYLSRPTAPAHWHAFDGQPDASVLSGRDLRAGGTWLGVNRAGRVAFLTNITEEPRAYASSRGALAAAFLLPRDPAEGLGAHAAALGGAYAGFNLLLLAPRHTDGRVAYDAALVTNHGGGGRVVHRALSGAERACGGLSNGVDGAGAERWPKVRRGTQLFVDALQAAAGAPQDDLVERLFGMLTWRSDEPPRARSELRNTIQIEPLQVPHAQGADGPLYGTRLSTVILVRRDGTASFHERDIWTADEEGRAHAGERERERVFEFQLDVAEEWTRREAAA